MDDAKLEPATIVRCRVPRLTPGVETDPARVERGHLICDVRAALPEGRELDTAAGLLVDGLRLCARDLDVTDEVDTGARRENERRDGLGSGESAVDGELRAI